MKEFDDSFEKERSVVEIITCKTCGNRLLCEHVVIASGKNLTILSSTNDEGRVLRSGEEVIFHCPVCGTKVYDDTLG